MVNKQVEEYLSTKSIGYRWVTHQPSYTARETASCAHIPSRQFAKTVVVRLNGKMALTVMSADEKLSLRRLKDTAGVHDVRLVSEAELEQRFPGCERGAMPPLGSLYGLPVFVSTTIAEDDEIAFNAGSHTEIVQLSYRDFQKLERPRIGDFAM
jgi:Ala-tRNA(Pro) deacylase